jgi:hypothetical protein
MGGSLPAERTAKPIHPGQAEFTDGETPGVRLRRRGSVDEGTRPGELTSENDG